MCGSGRRRAASVGVNLPGACAADAGMRMLRKRREGGAAEDSGAAVVWMAQLLRELQQGCSAGVGPT
jgi:hypothetical protein